MASLRNATHFTAASGSKKPQMSTTVITDDKIGVLHRGLSHEDLRAGDSITNVTTNSRTSRGSRSSHAGTSNEVRSLLAKVQAKKALLIAKQRQLKERVAIEQKRLQLLLQDAKPQQHTIKEDPVHQQSELYEDFADLSHPATDERPIVQVSVTQTHEDAVPQAEAPVDVYVTVYSSPVVMIDDIISIVPFTGEAGLDQLSHHSSAEYIAVPSAGAVLTAPEPDIAGTQSHVPTLPSTSTSILDPRLPMPVLMQQAIKTSASEVNSLERKTLQEESLQLQTKIDKQETQESVCQRFQENEQLTSLSRPSPSSQQVNQVSEMFQQLYIAKSPAASQVNALLDRHVTVQRNQVTTLDSVNAVSQEVSSAPSSTPNGEANWEQSADDNSTNDTGQEQLSDPPGYDPTVD